MAQSNVSAEFKKAWNRTNGIQEAQKAENTMGMSIKLPVGEYKVVFASLLFDVSEKKADGKGGNMYCNLDVVVLEGDHKGEKVTKNATFNDSTGASGLDKITWCLNELETLGLPRELRENGTPDDYVQYFSKLDPAPVFLMKIVEKESKGKMYKNIQFFPEAGSVDTSSSILPGDSNIAPPTQTSATTITWLSQTWNILDRFETPEGTKLKIQSQKTNKIREELEDEIKS